MSGQTYIAFSIIFLGVSLSLLWAFYGRKALLGLKTQRHSDPHKAVIEAMKGMVQITDRDVLLRLIVRSIEDVLEVEQIGLFFWDRTIEKYRLAAHRGRFRVARADEALPEVHPLIDWFEHQQKTLFPDHLSLLYTDVISQMRVDPVSRESQETPKVLRRVKNEMERFRCQVVVPSTYKNRLLAIVMLGAKKDGARFTQSDLENAEALSNVAAMGVHNGQLLDELTSTNQELTERIKESDSLRKKDINHFYQTIMTLAEAVNAKDQYTYSHLEEVEHIGQRVAERIYKCKGIPFDSKRRHILSTALKLHDLGKVGTPDHILKKPARLTSEEWVTMRQHPEVGARILSPIPTLREVAYIIRHHHENYDGTGYPGRLKGEEIPLEARIISVVDTYHAIVSTRPYRKGQPKEKAIQILNEMAGTQFDPEIVEHFVEVIQAEAA